MSNSEERDLASPVNGWGVHFTSADVHRTDAISVCATRRAARALLSDQVKVSGFPVQVPRSAVTGLHPAPVHYEQGALGAVPLAVVRDEVRECSIWTHIDLAKREIAVKSSGHSVPEVKVVTATTAGTSVEDRMSCEVDSLLTICARAATEAAQIGSGVLR